MEAFLTVLLVVGGVALVCLVIWAILHHRYVKSFEDKGWVYDGSPDISVVYGLNVAPFGMGFRRRVKKRISGNAPDGTPFSAVEYTSTNWDTGGLVVSLPLPHSMPLASLTAAAGQRWAIATGDADYARAIEAALAPLAGRDVTVDHANLVLLRVEANADPLEQALGSLTAARSALLASEVADRIGPEPPPGLSFSDHPDWAYIPQDDRFLQQVEHSGGGYAHEAVDIITSPNRGLPFVRLRHTWKTDSTTTDSEGRSHTTTTNHSEYLCQFQTTFPFIDLSANWGWFGRDVSFEWTEFNDNFRIKSSDPRRAHAIVHQRQMEYLMQVRAPKFAIEGDGSIHFKGIGGDWLPEDIVGADAFIRGFFARVPDFVWQDLGAWPRPIAELEPPTSG